METNAIHTTCRLCGQDIEGVKPFIPGQWRDRGNNTTCSFKGNHEPEPNNQELWVYDQLHKFTPKGGDLHCIVEVSRTGQSAYVRCYAIGPSMDKAQWPVNVTHWVHAVTGLKRKERDGAFWLVVGNCGYGRADYVAEELGEALYGDRAAIKGNVL